MIGHNQKSVQNCKAQQYFISNNKKLVEHFFNSIYKLFLKLGFICMTQTYENL